jgi:hypothetical protein
LCNNACCGLFQQLMYVHMYKGIFVQCYRLYRYNLYTRCMYKRMSSDTIVHDVMRTNRKTTHTTVHQNLSKNYSIPLYTKTYFIAADRVPGVHVSRSTDGRRIPDTPPTDYSFFQCTIVRSIESLSFLVVG